MVDGAPAVEFIPKLLRLLRAKLNPELKLAP
jgi:hypothetical protein